MSTLAATNLKHESSASNNIVLTSGGDVGIGTSSPGNKLDIVSAGSSQIRVKDGVSATAYYDFGRDGTDGFFGFSGAQTTFSGYKWSVNAGTEVMRITNGGNVGIGTSSPSAKLHVSGVAILPQVFSGGTANTLELYTGTAFNTSGAAIAIRGSTVGYNNSGMEFYAGGSERARINSSGYVSIGSTTTNGLLTVDGVGPTIVSQAFAYFAESGGAAVSGYASGQNVTNSIWASSRISGQEFNARSDGRLKKDVTPIPASDAWHFVQNVMPVHYKWINGPDNGHKFGFIAQDVVKAGFPNLIGQYSDSNVQEITDADGFTSPAGIALTVSYDQIIPVLAVTIKELKAEVDALKARIATLEAK